MNRVYISIHSSQHQSSVDKTSWRILVQSTKSSKLFHHSRKLEATIFEQRNGDIQARAFSHDDKASQVLKVLIGENRLSDMSGEVQTAFNQLSGDATAKQMIQQLQQSGVIRKFDLAIFTTIVEDRLRLILSGSRRHPAEEMNYLSYCQTPANAKSPAGKAEGSDYFMSAYKEPSKKTKKGFWLSYPQGQYVTVNSRDPYGGLM